MIQTEKKVEMSQQILKNNVNLFWGVDILKLISNI